MTKKGSYQGGSSIVTIYPSAGGTKPSRSKVGGLQIAANNWASNPPETFPLYPQMPTEDRVKTPLKKRKKPRIPKNATILE